MSVKVLGVGGVPTTGVQAVILNVHALDPSNFSALTVWPAGATRPAAPDFRTKAGDAPDALVTVAPGNLGNVNIFNSKGTTGLAIDVVGYYGQSWDGLRYQPVYPFQIGSTTVAPGGSNSFGRNATMPWRRVGPLLRTWHAWCDWPSVTPLLTTSTWPRLRRKPSAAVGDRKCRCRSPNSCWMTPGCLICWLQTLCLSLARVNATPLRYLGPGWRLSS